MDGRRVAVVVGTRPEIIKMAPVIGEIDRRLGPGAALVINSGQHYDASMSGRFWTELGIGEPAITLDAGGMSRAACIGHLVGKLGHAFDGGRPAAVIVQGDTNTTVAGALAANACGVPLVHVEAGLRSHDRAMPEEHNRVVADQLADLCCAATQENVDNLRDAGVPDSRIMLTGNPVVEAVSAQLPARAVRLMRLNQLGLRSERYLLATIHRPENTDDPIRLRSILSALVEASHRWDVPVLLPAHPRTTAAAKSADCEDLWAQLQIMDPLGARDFLTLAAHAALLVSDSGGVAEEVTVLKRPLIVVRRSTERPEAIDAGFAKLVRPAQVGDAADAVLEDLDDVLARLQALPSPYGTGRAAARIAWATHHLITATARAAAAPLLARAI